MNKKEAQSLVGKHLLCRTDLYGTYIGRCLSIKSEPRKPWRAVVEILAVVEYPTSGLSENSAKYLDRKPYGFGEKRDFGHSSVKVYDGLIPDYRDSVVSAILKKIELVKRAIEHARQFGLAYGLELRQLQVLMDHLKEIDPNCQID